MLQYKRAKYDFKFLSICQICGKENEDLEHFVLSKFQDTKGAINSHKLKSTDNTLAKGRGQKRSTKLHGKLKIGKHENYYW